MLAPTSASARAIDPNARAVIGRPSTTTTCDGVPARGRVVGGLQRGLHLHGDARHRLLDGLLQALRVVVRRDERAQREPTPDDDLLDVEQVDAVPGERGEEHGADAGPVRAGDRDENGGVPRHAPSATWGRRPGSARPPGPCAAASNWSALPPDVRLVPELLHQVRVVQLERGALGADAGQLGEVVPRRRAGGGPLQRVAEAPRVVHRDHPAVAVAAEHVPDERQRGGAQHERADRGDHVQRGEPVGGQVVGVAARHALVAQPVLHQERGVEPDEREPEVHLAQRLVHHPAGHLREPEVDARVGGEHDRAEQHVVEVRHHEVGVGDVEVDRRGGQQHAGEAAEQEGDEEAEREQHRRLERDLALPHACRSS